MNRIDRLQAILIQMQSKKVVKAQEIADRFGISIRTVYRDIRSLEEAGIPIGAEAGIGYFLDEDYNLPPVMFTPKEATALLLAGKLVPHLSDKSVETAYCDALFKIKSVLNSSDKEILDKLEGLVKVYMGMNTPPRQDHIYLQEIQKALVEQLVISIDYFSGYNQAITRRNVEPISLVFYAMNWHLVGFCRLRNEYRDFRLDRIQKLAFISEKFDKKLDQAFNEYLSQQQSQTGYFKITIEVSHTLALYIRDSKYWYGWVEENQVQDGFAMRFLNPDLDGFARWVTTMGDQVKILGPDELREKVLEMVDVLTKAYYK
jgi:predicted DNA-binding transcriptional regulator YafY